VIFDIVSGYDSRSNNRINNSTEFYSSLKFSRRCLWEFAIKASELRLHRMLGNANKTTNDPIYVIIRIMARLNSPPLCPLSADLYCFVAPGHILSGESPIDVPEPNTTATPIYRLNSQQLWSRRPKEYSISITITR